jgi:tetratricopeptide (TPR) repeat protein
MSQAYAAMGQLTQSERAMSHALALAPHDRFVLRSAVRLYVHLDEPDRAARLLRRTEATRQDPWLIAADIAVATVAGAISPLVRIGRTTLAERRFPPFHVAELASALATLELSAGANRKARKLFEASLHDPTENSVAQATWARRWLPALDTDHAILSTPRTYEARVWNAFSLLDWHEVASASNMWFADEPFSSRPAEMGSYAAAVGLEDYLLAELMLRRALAANPSDDTLINNLAFALANQGNLDEALRVLGTASRPSPRPSTEAALKATEGLIRIRAGHVQQGIALYQQAISEARGDSMARVRYLASIYLARELLIAHRSDAVTAMLVAEATCGGATDPDVLWLLARLRHFAEDPRRGLT